MGVFYKRMLQRGIRGLYCGIFCCFFWGGTGYFFGTANAQTVQGTVYRDFNADGLKTNTSTFNEIGVKNVLVCAYRKDGTLADSTRTAADGTYTLSNAPSSDSLRIEFKDFQGGDYDGPFNPSGSNTSVQFVTGNSTGVNLGINYPNHYCETTNPQMVTTCFVAVNAATTPLGDRDVLVGVPFEVIDTVKTVSHYAFVKDVGSVWGIAYKRETSQIFTAAFTKRHVGFAEQGPGAIFVTNLGSLDTTTTEFFNFGQVAGTNMHTDLPDSITNNNRLDSYDIPAYDAVGKVGLGDIDISDDGKTLWVTNLNNRKLYALNIATKDTIGYSIPNPCAGKSYRPFATKYYRGNIYIGVVCTREDAVTKTDTADLSATVYAFDGSSFKEVLHFPLTYLKGASNADIPIPDARANLWRPWIALPYFAPDRDNNFLTYPQPWITDIEFDVDGSMILGVRDRFADQIGFRNRKPIENDTSFITVIGPGEILRAGPCGPNGTWVIENNGTVCGSTASIQQTNAEGLGGGKYYWGDRPQDGANHEMSSQAGLALLAGSGKVAMTAINPTDVPNAGGIKRLINSNGNKDGNPTGEEPNPNGGAILYYDDVFGFGKANGLGDLELLCAPQPIEIGNRIWKDVNKNGIQDANERGIDGVTVTLCDSSGNALASVVTGNGGQYYFSSAMIGVGPAYAKYKVGLKPTTKYTLKIGDFTTQNALLNLIPVNANQAADNIDSDFEVNGTNLTFTLNTGSAGQNNFKADAGFQADSLRKIDLALKKLISKKTAQIGDTITYTIKVWNEFDNPASNVQVIDSIATSVLLIPNSFSPSRGTANIVGNAIQWNIGNMAPNGDTVTLSYQIKVTQEGIHFNTAEISNTDQKDRDSTPNNGKEDEDDMDRQCFTVPIKLCAGEKVQVSVPAKYTGVQWFKAGEAAAVAVGNQVMFTETGTYTFTALNNTCPLEGCCPIIIEPGDNCCPEQICIPFTIKQSKKAGKKIL